MLKICLVEDEEYALKSLHQKIINLRGPYEVVGTAYNGIDAIDIIVKQHPDVLITDIRMPDMDGISLIEHLNKNNISVVSIIISGYQEFDYAKSAFKLGVEDYLLKPVVESELKECLAKCEEKVNQKKNNKRIDDVLSENGIIRYEDVGYFLVYMIFGNAISNPDSIIHPSIFYIPSQNIEHRFDEIMTCSSPAFCFIGMYFNEKVIIVQSGNMTESLLLYKLHELAEKLEQEYKFTVTISYQTINRSDLIGAQISSCRKIALQSALLGISNIVSDIPRNHYKMQNINDAITYLSLCIHQKQTDSLKARVHGLLDEWNENHYPLCAIQNDLIYITNSLKHSLPVAGSSDFTITYYIENIVSISNTYIDLADNYYCLLVEHFGLSAASSSQTVSPVQIVEQIEQYFRNNLSNNFTLGMLCAEMNYSKVYLCRVFKKVKNTTPMDYFIQLKIEKAKSMIRQHPSTPIKIIADSLGFNDVYYFSRVFKRITGQTPSSVRGQARGAVASAKGAAAKEAE